jgi:SAM-dependent methyltransferase
MNRDLEGLEQVAGAFDLQWKLQSSGALESETLYGWTEEQDWTLFRAALDVRDADLDGAMVLDAGCGTASFTRQIAGHGAAFAIGVDVAASIDEAFDACRDLPNTHIVQANVAALPFADGSFDLVWCRGVLHHTPDPVAGHHELARTVRPGGKLYVWVYSRRFSPFRFVKDVLDALRVTRLPPRALFALCRVLAYPSLALLATYRLVRKLPGLRPTTARGNRVTRGRGLRELQLTWFDALAPEHNSRHTEDEVNGWFRSVGFEEITSLSEPKIGVRGVKPAEAR